MARSFNDATDRIDYARTWDPQGAAFSFAAWVYLTQGSEHSYLFHIGIDNSNYGFGITHRGDTAQGIPVLMRRGSTVLYRKGSAGDLVANAWTHLIVTHDGTITDATTAHIYCGGIEVTYSQTTNGASESAYAATNWSIGGRDYDDSRNFGGYLAEVAIWNRVISAGEIAALAARYSPIYFPAGIMGYWPLVRDTWDRINNDYGTLDGTAVVAHPPVIYPGYSLLGAPAAGGAATLTPSVSDSAGVADSPAVALAALAISRSDTTSVADAPVVQPIPQVSVSDSAGVADSAAVALAALAPSVADGATVADSPAVVLPDALAAVVSDSAGVADAPAARPQITRAVSDSVGVAASATARPQIGASASDSAGVADTAAVTLPDALAASISDSAGVADAPTVRPQIGAAVSDSAGAADAIGVALPDALAASVADGASVADTASAQPQIEAGASDSAGAADAATVTLPDALKPSISDTVSVADAPTAQPQIGASVADGAGVADAATVGAPAVSAGPVASDSTSVADSVTVALDAITVNAADGAAVSDQPETQPQIDIGASDSAGVSDAASLALDEAISVAETADVADAVTLVLGDEEVSTSESAGVADTASATIALEISASDSAGVADEVLASWPLPASAADATSISELITIGLGTLIVAVGDTTALADAPIAEVVTPSEPVTRNISVSDGAALSETVWMAALAAFKIDVAVSDALVGALDATDAAVSGLAVAEAAASVAISDSSRG